MSTKNVRTRINKESRIEFRCSKAFKSQLEEIAVQHGTTLSKLIESACTGIIKTHLPTSPLPCTGKIDQDEVNQIILNLSVQGLSTRKVADKLNELGYKNAKGQEFTHNMVNLIIKKNDE